MHGAKDDQGRLLGEVRCWDAAGALISTTAHVAGKPHGLARRYYANGELAHEARYVDGVLHGEHHHRRCSDPAIPAGAQLGRLADAIATHVCTYEHGDLIGQQYFDAHGIELDSNGRAMPPRPPGIPPTAFTIPGQGWLWSRRAGGTWLESREYDDRGVLRRERDHRTGADRAYHDNGVLRFEGQRATGASHHLIGTWRYFDREGRPLLIVRHEERSRAAMPRCFRVWHREGLTREGAVEGGLEHGEWIVRDARGQIIATWDLGPRMDATELLEHPVCADELDDTAELAPRDRSLPSMLLRARRAGITGNIAELGLDPGPAWQGFDADGHPVRLDREPSNNAAAHIHALRWGPPDAALLADLAATLFRAGRAGAALDVVDASLALTRDPAAERARATYLRVLGRTAEAEHAIARPDKLDAPALALLAEIRQHPADDGPRLVFADHVAARFPEHAAVIVAQCQGLPDEALVRAFLATLPSWIGAAGLERGFFTGLRHLEAEELVAIDPDLLYRVAPAMTAIELSDACAHVATLVTLPALRRYRELAFSDTYLTPTSVAQLAACPYLDQLEDLGLSATGLDDDDLATLARGGFPRLRRLDLGEGREDQFYGLAGLRALVGAAFATTLEHLSLAGRRLGDEVVPIVAGFPALGSLELSRTHMTDAAVPALLGLPQAITRLWLAHNDFTEDGRRALRDHFGDRAILD